MSAIDDFEAAMACALALPGTEQSRFYGAAAAKATATGRAFLATGHEPDTSFVLILDRESVDLLMATEPETYWQSPHYVGSNAVLVRFDSPDPERVRRTIAAARDLATAANPVRPRRA